MPSERPVGLKLAARAVSRWRLKLNTFQREHRLMSPKLCQGMGEAIIRALTGTPHYVLLSFYQNVGRYMAFLLCLFLNSASKIVITYLTYRLSLMFPVCFTQIEISHTSEQWARSTASQSTSPYMEHTFSSIIHNLRGMLNN